MKPLPPPDGAELIARERERQIVEERWTKEHDDQHRQDELALAAACYALPEYARSLDSGGGGMRVSINVRHLLWPFSRSWWKPSSDRINELTKAGALIAAEIDRLQRAAQSPAKELP